MVEKIWSKRYPNLAKCELRSKMLDSLFWVIITIVGIWISQDDLTYGSLWVLTIIIPLAILYIGMYKAVEERYLGNLLRDNVKNYKLEKILFLHRLLFFCVFVFFLALVLRKWNLYGVEDTDALDVSQGSFIVFLNLILMYVAHFTGLFSPASDIRLLERITGSTSRWLSRLFAFMVFALVFLVWLGGSEVKHEIFQEVAFTFVITVALGAMISFYPKVISFFTKLKLDDALMTDIANRVYQFLLKKKNICISCENDFHIVCRTLEKTEKKCKRAGCNCGTPLIDITLLYGGHAGRSGREFERKVVITLSDISKFEHCFKQFLKRAAGLSSEFEIDKLSMWPVNLKSTHKLHRQILQIYL